MSQVNTQQMGRMVAAGNKERLGEAVEILARLEALHIIDYDGGEDGFSLGSPERGSEAVGRDLVKARSAASVVEASGPIRPVPEGPVRNSLGSDLPAKIDEVLTDSSRIDDLNNEISSLLEEEIALSQVAPLSIDLELLGGYESITSFVGTVENILGAREAVGSGLIIEEKAGKSGLVAAFVRNEESGETSTKLEQAGFESIQIPEGEGSASARLSEVRKTKGALEGEKYDLEKRIDQWSKSNGEMLLCGLEVLERDHDVLTAPVRIAVSEHAFVIDGWVAMARSKEVRRALNEVCLFTEITPFEMEAGGGGHGHSDHHHSQKMPPIAFQERSSSRPMELLTDAVGRPAYGRIDPTIFMFITYPIFFGIMLGDMAYGLVTIGLGALLVRKSSTNEMLELGGKFLMYIGFGTVVFGYLYAEFAGWEIFPHHSSNPAEVLQMLYPSISEGAYHVWDASLPLGIELAFPFHRVVMVDDHGNLEHLILLTIYLGIIHVFLGLVIGFRDIMLFGNGHGGFGFVCAFFEKGTWMILLVGGFMFAYGFIGPAEWMMQPGAAIAISATVMLMWTLYKYHGVPFPINIGLAPIEAIGMMPTVISYVRLFAVGVVGVKIAETGNSMLFDKVSFDEPLMAILLVLGWLAVQFFAWGLGVFSPNIHAARLHFVEWMRQYYDSSGEVFNPFGLRTQYVEVD
jgi:V/A-type H+-transporting ATPase subunit I